MTYAFALKITKQTLRTAHVAVICAMLVYSQVASAALITLGSNMNVRTQGDDGLSVAGVLGKGSVVEIPDQFIVKDKNGKVDADKSFSKWLHTAGYTNSQIKRKTSGTQDFFFPVKIVSIAGKSNSKLLKSKKQLFMALRVLERTSGGLRVKETARAYNPSSAFKPMHGISRPAPKARSVAKPRPAQPSKSASVKSERAPERSRAPAPTLASPPVPEPQPEIQDSPPPAADDQSNTEAQDPNACPTCGTKTDPAEDQGRTLSDETMGGVYDSEAQGLQGLGDGFNARCENFIKPDGSYGEWGQQAIRTMSTSKFSNTFLNAQGMDRACPNFDRFNDAQKRHFWVYLLASVAEQESGGCQVHPSEKHQSKMIVKGGKKMRFNPNGIASGLFQVEKDPTLRDSRDRKYGGTYCAGNVYDGSTNTRCAVAMLEDIVDANHGPFSSDNHYWSALSYSETKAKALISHYNACGASPLPIPSDSGASYRGMSTKSKSKSKGKKSGRHK